MAKVSNDSHPFIIVDQQRLSDFFESCDGGLSD